MNEEEVLKTLNTSPKGLSNEEVKRRLKEYNYNELKETKRRTTLGFFVLPELFMGKKFLKWR